MLRYATRDGVHCVAFHVAKGGVGKTSLAGNTAYLASRARRVVLIDADPQGSATSWLAPAPCNSELADVLKGEAELNDALVPLASNLELLPSSGLTGGLKQFAETVLVRRPAVFDRLRRALTEHGTDLVIYDLSPGMSLLERSVLMSVDEVVLPALAEYFSVDGINTAALLLAEINADWDRDVRADKLVVNALNRSFRRHVQAHADYRRLDRFDLFTVAQDAKVAESQFMHQPLPVYEAGSKVIPELQRLADALGGS